MIRFGFIRFGFIQFDYIYPMEIAADAFRAIDRAYSWRLRFFIEIFGARVCFLMLLLRGEGEGEVATATARVVGV